MNEAILKNILNAYIEEEFQSLIKNKILRIEEIINQFIDEESLDIQNKISKKIVPRVKSEESLREKLKRNNYIDKWQLKEKTSKEDIQSTICKNLPDLIGLKINCFFKKDEKCIFEKLCCFLKEKKHIQIEDEPNTKQKNGHDIYKISCQYKEMSNVFCFEIQVKSFLHDIWGEVEHSIIYKNRSYDSTQDFKYSIIDGIYNILDGADKQLNKLYSSRTAGSIEKELKHEMFFLYSYKEIIDKENILGEHYTNFFKLASYIKDSDLCIDEYLGSRLLKKEYSKKETPNIDDSIEVQNYKLKIDQYKFFIVYNIASVLYNYKEPDDFLKHLICRIKENAKNMDDEFENECEEEGDHVMFDNILLALDCIRQR